MLCQIFNQLSDKIIPKDFLQQSIKSGITLSTHCERIGNEKFKHLLPSYFDRLPFKIGLSQHLPTNSLIKPLKTMYEYHSMQLNARNICRSLTNHCMNSFFEVHIDSL